MTGYRVGRYPPGLLGTYSVRSRLCAIMAHPYGVDRPVRYVYQLLLTIGVHPFRGAHPVKREPNRIGHCSERNGRQMLGQPFFHRATLPEYRRVSFSGRYTTLGRTFPYLPCVSLHTVYGRFRPYLLGAWAPTFLQVCTCIRSLWHTVAPWQEKRTRFFRGFSHPDSVPRTSRVTPLGGLTWLVCRTCT
jgi:hypothetical protein